MNKKITVLISIFVVMFNFNISRVDAQNTEVIPHSIYDTDYPNDYPVWVDSALVNRVINEFSLTFNLELDESQVEQFRDRIMINLEEEESIDLNQITVSYGAEYSNYVVFTISMDEKWSDYSLTTFEKLVSILNPEITDEQIESFYVQINTNEFITIEHDDIELSNSFIFKYFEDDYDNELLISEIAENKGEIILSDSMNKVDALTDSLLAGSSSFNKEDYYELEYLDILSENDGLEGTKHRFKATVGGYYEFDDKQVLVHFIRDNKAIQEYLGTYALAPEIPLIDGSKVEVFGTLMGNQTMEWDDGTSTDFPLLIIDRVVEIDDF